ncbi:hypothetical protein B0J15DRAFT_473354 [Fusarium solani]|uniref:Prion-inhibition and propagation HeLo domain-containing protein n=1 Tax=Fusarium solani TaxID=169388 RepID=A0A9P9G0E9_FUSSL|nr:uncharacterized protein B0J15DRAFT_473354 [Fusarium solani]KAH7227280.1 hypothetical protein B0J15DRAFT_473354 [Fusarium solani]
MADAAGLVFSMPGLLFTCVQYYQAFLAYANEQKDRQDLCIRFEIEQKVFSNWKAKAMPDGRTVLTSDPAMDKLTVSCLGQIKAAFEECAAISDVHAGANSSQPVALESLVSRLKKIGWALNGAKTANELWKKLNIYNDALNRLWNLSDGSVQRRLLPELDNFNNTEGLRLMEVALRRADLAEYRELAAAVRLRRVALEAREAADKSFLDLDADFSLMQFDDNMELDAGSFEPPISADTWQLPRTAKVHGQDVLLEWKVYETQNPTALIKRQYERLVGRSMRSLAKLLSQEPKPTRLRALNCIGFYEPPAEGLSSPVCFAFRPPPNAFTQPISLANLISRKKRSFNHSGVSVDTRHFLGDRFALALTLTRAIYQLHYLGWLHKGYEFARPASQAGLSIPMENTAGVAVYHHPRYIDSGTAGYEPQFDLYSLGIVLIEIARWQTAGELARYANVDTSKPQEWNLYVVDYLLPVVEEKMGQVCGDVVRRCIKGTVGGSSPTSQTGYKEYLKSLDADVVARLELCFA